MAQLVELLRRRAQRVWEQQPVRKKASALVGRLESLDTGQLEQPGRRVRRERLDSVQQKRLEQLRLVVKQKATAGLLLVH